MDGLRRVDAATGLPVPPPLPVVYTPVLSDPTVYSSTSVGPAMGAMGGVAATPPRSTRRMVLIGAIVVLALVAIFLTWRRMYYSVPDCAAEGGFTQGVCRSLTAACEGDTGCLNAVAHCLPVADGVLSGGGVDPWALKSCTRAVGNVDPALAARIITAHDGNGDGPPRACLPYKVAGVLEDPAALGAITGAAAIIAPLAPFAIQVASKLPACPSVVWAQEPLPLAPVTSLSVVPQMSPPRPSQPMPAQSRPRS